MCIATKLRDIEENGDYERRMSVVRKATVKGSRALEKKKIIIVTWKRNLEEGSSVIRVSGCTE